MIGLIGPLGPFELLASLAFMLAFAAGGPWPAVRIVRAAWRGGGGK